MSEGEKVILAWFYLQYRIYTLITRSTDLGLALPKPRTTQRGVIHREVGWLEARKDGRDVQHASA